MKKQLYKTGKQRLLQVLPLLLFAGPALAQNKVKGTVLDEKGAGMPGVTIAVISNADHKQFNTMSDGEGIFMLDPIEDNGVYDFIFTAVGYENDTVSRFKINQGDNNSLLVRMKVARKSLNDVIVVGYGTQSKARVTGAISQIRSADLNKYAGSSFGSQLAGKVAGVTINEASGMPGTDPQIVIRGVSTLTAGANPLIVVDGFPLSEGSSLNSINPQDIETMDILKDPSSAAIYGSRAANGVILITTRSAQKDKTTVSFDAYSGFQQRADKVKLVDGYQYALYSTEARDWGYVSKDPAKRKPDDDVATRKANGATARDYRLSYMDPYLANQPGLTNTNWLDAITRTAPINSYTLSVSGSAGAKSNYYLSANYFNQQGIVLNTGLKRYSMDIKVGSRPFSWLKTGLSLVPSYNQQRYFNNNADRSTDPISSALVMYPMFSPYNADGSLAISQQIKANTPEDGALMENPVAILKMNTYNRNFFRNFGNTFLEFHIADGLSFKTLLGGDFQSNYINYYSPSTVGAYRTAAPKPAVASETNGYVWNYISENTLTYDKRFGDHDINVLAGYSFQKENGNSTLVNGTNIPDDNLGNIAGASNFSVIKTAYTWAQISYFSRFQYAYKDKYLLTAAIRRDGSSRFGAQSKYGNFPSVTAGWILSNEAFLQKQSWLDLLKLRASWGKAGNNQIGSYGALALVNPDNYVYGGNLAPGYAAAAAPNANLGWESKQAINAGFDLGLFHVLTLSANFYRTITSDLLLNVPVPAQSGYISSLQNLGKVKNTGFEFELAGNNISLGKVKWSFNANLTTNRNTVLALAPGQTQILTGSNSVFLTKVGGPIAEMYGYDVTGIYKSQDQINSTPHMDGTVVGDYIMRDIDGDGKITTADRKGFGSYAPKLVYGFQNTFSYGNFELSIGLNGIVGRKIYDAALWSMESGESFGLANEYYYKNRWDPKDNPDGTLARPTTNLSANRLNARASNQFVYSGDYLRIRNIQLAYRFNLRSKFITGLRVYATANNPFTFTSYRGFNPDATTTDNVLTSGYAYSNYPVAKSYILGVNLTF
ncbi:SusC/RagA family TonB-linked outer membrane protein [Taibaiella chishuiensis]|uniref:TonB-linked SusC/RagA family outer membrane protein n=1 Tax=Taibaiella chishuiensis TaxID=1434707 RepID=A0A2P8CX38_9BACT|nr:TonB-dependent receptor [Taibaiella chishuiensis]PSK89524.1 TonB-linked SusC/RagA family outer membrane protein [Taibaiella chishuiensis]